MPAVIQAPPRSTRHQQRAERMLRGGDKQGAVVALLEAVRSAPRNAGLHRAICALLCDLGRHDSAVGAGLVATELAPDDPRGLAELGRAFFLAGQNDAALPLLARAVTLAPQDLAAIVTLSAVLFTVGRFEMALDVAREAVSIDPMHGRARANLALALEALGRLDEAESHSRRAMAAEPDTPAAQHNLAGLLLSRGTLTPEAWRLYDGRLGLTPEAKALAAVPRWDGTGDIAGRTILLHAEQGLGDTIQFIRYAPMLAARGARVIAAVQKPLVRLLRGMDGLHDVIEAGSTLPRFDLFCPIAGLPGAFGTTMDTIPGPARLPPRAAVPPPGGPGLHVGLVWAGNPGFVSDRLRSIPAAEMRALEGVPGVVFHALQFGAEPCFSMQDRLAGARDFADTAEIVAGLDLVIAVDTAVAHLAASMGRPVWLLSRFLGCWRWLRGREDSPWYPGLRVFKQQSPGDWTAVLHRIRADLAALATDTGHAP